MANKVNTASRRDFLRQASATAGVLASAAAPAWGTAPNGRLGVACIGTGGMGTQHLRWLLSREDIHVAAVCDVDAAHRTRAASLAPDAAVSGDFREVIDRDDVDTVFVATPDHWHALVTIAAARAGKHVYCEKPLANSIGEGRAIADAIKEAGVLLQTGSHERSNPGAAIAKQLVAEGRLGDVKRVQIHLPNADEHLQAVENFTTPPPDSDPPEGLDYNFWLGHTPARAYNEKRCHFWWRFHSRYGGGEITDRGAHVIDLAHMILGLDQTGPVRVEARGQRPKGDFYDAFITFEFENQYADGLRLVGNNRGQRGLTLEGPEGKLFVAVHGCALTATPASMLDDVTLENVNAYDVHRDDFVRAIQEGKSVVAPAEAGHRTATACHLNNLAMRLERPIDWDPATERASDPEVNAMLTPTMRQPWSL